MRTCRSLIGLLTRSTILSVLILPGLAARAQTTATTPTHRAASVSKPGDDSYDPNSLSSVERRFNRIRAENTRRAARDQDKDADRDQNDELAYTRSLFKPGAKKRQLAIKKAKPGKEEEQEYPGIYEQALLYYLRPRVFPFDRFNPDALISAARQRDALPAARIGAAPANAAQAVHANAAPPPAGQSLWSTIGPPGWGDGTTNFISWRVNGVAYDPINTNIIYVAATNGGVWKTTDGGSTWTPLTDNQLRLATSCVTVDWHNDNNVYVGTGDYDGGNGPGFGVLKSTNGGRTWTITGAAQFGTQSIHRITIDPHTPSRIFATAGTNGLFRSLNSGKTWQMVIGPTALATAPAVNGSFSNVVYNSVGDTIYASADNAGIYVSTNGGNSWTQMPGAPTGTGRFDVCTSLDTSFIGKRTLYVASAGPPGQDGKVYIGTPPPTNPLAAIAFTQLNNFPKSPMNEPGILWNQKGYDFFIGCTRQTIYVGDATKAPAMYPITPTPSDVVYVGLVDLWQSQDGGQLWQPATGYHTDHHAFAVNPQNPNEVLIGNDGGVYKEVYVPWQTPYYFPPGTNNPNGLIPANLSVIENIEPPTVPATLPTPVPLVDLPTFGTFNYTPINNGLSIAQFYSAGYDANTVNTAIGGTQDNGTVFSFGTTAGWSLVLGGDGGDSGIDQLTGGIQYASIYGLKIFNSLADPVYPVATTLDSWVNTFFDITLNVGDDNEPFILTGGMSTAYPHIFYATTNYVYEYDSTVGAWSKLLTDFSYNNYITAIADAPSSAVVVGTLSPGKRVLRGRLPNSPGPITHIATNANIFVGTLDGYLYFSGDNGNTFTEIDNQGGPGGLPVRSITDIKVSPVNPDRIFVTVSGTGTGHVYRCDDVTAATPTFVDISRAGQANGLPDIFTNAVAVLPRNNDNEIFAGTDVGVFYTNNGGSTWQNATGTLGLPNAQVNKLNYVPGTSMLMAATYGRGMWELPVSAITIPTTTLEISPYLQYYVGSRANLPVTLQFQVGNQVAFTVSGTLNAAGLFTTNLSAQGTYDVYVTIPRFLRRKIPGVVLNGTTQLFQPQLINGDVNGDNVVNTTDLALIQAAMGEYTNGTVDLNGDHVVNFMDLYICNANQGQVGD